MELPTIFDRLAAKKVGAGYYYGNFSFLLLYQKHKEISHQHATFFKQCKTGKLPSFSYVDPNWTFHDEGPSSGNEGNDDHPHADIRAGEYFMSQIYNAVTQSPAWRRTLLIFTFDEWGGFYDHVPPPAAHDVKPEYQQRGFRIPCVLVSPYARRGRVAHGMYDHTSILKLIEWRWVLAPLSVRDARARISQRPSTSRAGTSPRRGSLSRSCSSAGLPKLTADQHRRAGERRPKHAAQHRVRQADAAVRDGAPHRPRLVRTVDRDRAALRPAGQHRQERRDTDYTRPEGAGDPRYESLVHVVATERRRRRRRADRRARAQNEPAAPGTGARGARRGRP